MEERYSRHLDIPEIGTDGRLQLEQSTVTVIGAGGLGATVLLCMAGLGVGCLRIVDGDVVTLSNLDRQFLYEEKDIGKPKAFAAQSSLRRRNGLMKAEAIMAHVTAENAEQIVSGANLVILAVDNYEARQVVNRACCRQGRSLLNGGVRGMYGSLQMVVPGKTACLACAGNIAPGRKAADPSPPPVVAWTASLMAQAGMLWLLGRTEHFKNTLVYLDGNRFILKHTPLSRVERCPVCGVGSIE